MLTKTVHCGSSTLKSFDSYDPEAKNLKGLRKNIEKGKANFWPLNAKNTHCGSSILKKFLLLWAKSEKL
jgi:hypothetical protein